jgi:hypothetical protein
MAANVNVQFELGLGKLTANLNRGGTIIASGSVATSGVIPFPQAMSGDGIEIEGVCTNAAVVTISVPTMLPTPVNYPEGPILDSFTIN